MAEWLPARNRLLEALRHADPAAEAQLRVGLESVELKLHAKVIRPDRPISHVCFPETGVLSHIQQMHNGSTVEVSLVGSDGMAGLAVYLGGATFPVEVICSAPGTFLRMPSAEFRAEVARNPPLHKVLHGYTLAVLESGAQSMGCDRFHSVEARAARWLLEMDDRVPQDAFTMTHEFLAMILGVRRQTVSVAVSQFSRQGCIVYQRGQVRIIDRVGLEGAACECYEVVRDAFAQLVGHPSHAPARLCRSQSCFRLVRKGSKRPARRGAAIPPVGPRLETTSRQVARPDRWTLRPFGHPIGRKRVPEFSSTLDPPGVTWH